RNGKDEVTAYADPRSLVTTYVRNGFGDVIQRGSPDSGTTVYQVNALGKPTQITDGRGVVTNLGYDNAGRLTSKDYPAAPAESVAYTWDSILAGDMGVGRLTRIDDESGALERIYDTLGRVVQEMKAATVPVVDTKKPKKPKKHNMSAPALTGAVGYQGNYAYDADGKIRQVVYPTGRTVTYARDALGRIAAVTTQKDAASPVVTLAANVAYQPFGPLAAFAYGNGLTLTRTFTPDYLINTLTVTDGV